MRATIPLLLAACRPSSVPAPPGEDTAPAAADWPRVLVNEVMASNRGTLEDTWGRTPDWVELLAAGEEAVPLDGWALARDPGGTDATPLDGLVVEPGSPLLLWADGDPERGPGHLDFRLDADGDGLALLAPDGTVVDALSFGAQAPDVSLARAHDGAARWVLSAEPTPGASNGPGEVEPPPATWPVPAPACGVAADWADPWFWEGEEVAAALSCTEEGADDVVLEAVRLPDGATFDGEALDWATGAADGGRVDAALSAATPAAGDGLETPVAETLTFWVADNPELPDAVPPDPATYTEEWGLPVVFVDPAGGLSSAYAPATVWFRGHEYAAKAKIRGASSYYYPKQSYTLRFDDEEIDVDEWGVHRDHVVLLTTFDDNSYVRQKLVYDQWAAIAEFWGAERLVPRTMFVVVYLDGAYHGLYVLLDRIDDEFLDQMGLDRDSNLYKGIDHDANFYLTGSDGLPKDTLHDGYEKKEGEPEDDFWDLDALVEFTGNATDEELLEQAAEWFDPAEFMDWLILVQYAAAHDSGGKNSYLAAAPGSLFFHYAPWDFNYSWGQNWRTLRVPVDSVSDFAWTNRIFAAFQSVPSAADELWARFDAMRAPGGPYDPAWIEGKLDDYFALIEPSAERDWARWGDAYRSYPDWSGLRPGDDWTTYQEEKEYVYEWVRARAALYEELHPPGQAPSHRVDIALVDGRGRRR